MRSIIAPKTRRKSGRVSASGFDLFLCFLPLPAKGKDCLLRHIPPLHSLFLPIYFYHSFRILSISLSAGTTLAYEFWWDVCDYYLELIKPVTRGDDAAAKRSATRVLYVCEYIFIFCVSVLLSGHFCVEMTNIVRFSPYSTSCCFLHQNNCFH